MEDDASVKRAPESQWRLRGRQLATAASPLMLMFVVGLSYFYEIVPEKFIVPHLTTYRIEYGQGGFVDTLWILPGNVLPMMLSSLVSGVLMDKIGRKLVLALTCPLFVVGWLTLGFSSTQRYLVTGRMICSIGTGSITTLAPVYIGEISDPSFRSVLLVMINVSLCLGMYISACYDLLINWRQFAWLNAAISFLGWCVCFTCKESPVWLMNTGQSDQAQWVYLWGWKSLNEFRAMEGAVKMEYQRGLDNKCSCLKCRYLSKHFLWPLAVTCVLFFTWQFSGFNEMAILVGRPVRFVIFGEDRTMLAILVSGLVCFVVTVIGCALVARYPRRTMALVSLVGASCSLFLASISFYLITLPSVIGYCFTGCLLIFLCIGLSPLSLVFVGELFPRNLRGLGAGLAVAFSWACALVDSKMGMSILETWTVPGVAMFYAMVVTVGALFLYWKLPETKDKTLLEIEMIFDEEDHWSDPADIEMNDKVEGC